MTLHGIDFDFNPLRVEDAERYDKALARMKERSAHPPAATSLAEILRYQCAAIDGAMSDLLGADYAAKTGVDTGDWEALAGLFQELVNQSAQKIQTVKSGFGANAVQPSAVSFPSHGHGKRRRH